MTPLLVALGAALGAALRYAVAHTLDHVWPAGTLLVNVTGSGILGLVAGVGPGEHWWALLATGFCGALTPYSAFAVQAVDRPSREGLGYVVATVVGCVTACAAGWWVGGVL